MTWTLHRQQQQRGAQLPNGGAPAVAVEDRAAQDHEQAGGTPQQGDSPASPLEHRDGDSTPSEPDRGGEWDRVVQPEPQAGETEPAQDGRGDDAEPVADASFDQVTTEQALEEAARGDRND